VKQRRDRADVVAARIERLDANAARYL